jgi:hypothetical protein
MDKENIELQLALSQLVEHFYTGQHPVVKYKGDEPERVTEYLATKFTRV